VGVESEHEETPFSGENAIGLSEHLMRRVLQFQRVREEQRIDAPGRYSEAGWIRQHGDAGCGTGVDEHAPRRSGMFQEPTRHAPGAHLQELESHDLLERLGDEHFLALAEGRTERRLQPRAGFSTGVSHVR
jgi:hypothetical protein